MILRSDLIPTEELESGMIVAESVISETGKLLLKPGLSLTKKNIKKLYKWRTSYVTVKVPRKIHPLQDNFLKTYEKTLAQVAATFEKISIFGQVPIKECEELVEDYIVLMTNVTGVITILHRVKSHNEYTFGHSLNVAIIAGTLGKWLGFTEKDLRTIILAGLLHDIGKMLIPLEILDKPGKLTTEEMKTMREHPNLGYGLVSNCNEISQEIKLGILQHHERQDGSGYPKGLKGEETHIYANIVAIADVYDAMSSKRVYRCQLPPFVVVETILEQMYEKLNPKVCLTFLKNIRSFMVGSFVSLSDGRQGKIVLLNDLLPIRPVVQLANGNLIDLEQNRQLEIIAVLDDGFPI